MFKENKLYRVENGRRVYDSEKGGVFEFTYSEIVVNFEQYINIGTKIFYLVGSSKHTFSLSDSDINYLYTIGLRWYEPLKFVFSKNVELIKVLQKSDLFLLTFLKNCEFVYLLPRLDNKNKFYFNLVLGVKPDFDINQFYNWNLKSINITNVIEVTDFNLNYDFIKKIFDFENCKFRDNSFSEEEYGLLCDFNKDESNRKKWGSNNIDKISSRWHWKFIFKQITNHCYWYNDKIFRNGESIFFIDYKWDSSFVLKKTEDGGLIGVKQYMYVGGLKDTFEYNEETVNFRWLVLH